MTQIPLVDVRARLADNREQLNKAIDEVIASGRLILGPNVKSLEEQIAEFCGVSHGIGVSSGTDAILASLMALGVGPGDEVITTPISFFATVGAILRLGARPVFADIDAGTFNLDANLAAEKITSKTKSVEVVHIFGQCAEIAPLTEPCSKVGAVIVEDAAQAIGARRDGKPAGSLGTVACFSFFPTKNLGCLGDGGMIVTDSEELSEKLRILRAHGAKPKYYHHAIGGNFRLDEIQAAALRVMFPSLESWNEKRIKNADRYDELFRSSDLVARERIVLPVRDAQCHHIFHHYVLRIPEKRDELRDFLQSEGIATAVYYPVCLHLQPCIQSLGYKPGDLPIAELASKQVLAIPVYPELREDQQDRVVDSIRRFFSRD